MLLQKFLDEYELSLSDLSIISGLSKATIHINLSVARIKGLSERRTRKIPLPHLI